MVDSSTYPGTLDPDLRALVPTVTPPEAEDFLQLMADAVRKIELELGVNPAGASDDIAARLTALTALAGAAAKPTIFQVALSDQDTPLVLKDNLATYTVPVAVPNFVVRAYLGNSASSSGAVAVDIKKNGTSIFSGTSYLKVNQSSFTSVGSTAYALVGSDDLAAGDRLTFSVKGAGTGATGLQVAFIETV